MTRSRRVLGGGRRHFAGGVHGHRLTLCLQDVVDCLHDLIVGPKRRCASMASPFLAIPFLRDLCVQRTARVSLEVAKDRIPISCGRHDGVHVGGSDVCGVKAPLSAPARFNQSLENDLAARPVEPIRRTPHQSPLDVLASGCSVEVRSPGGAVLTVNGPALVSVDAGSIA